jgi:hypothetical protein
MVGQGVIENKDAPHRLEALISALANFELTSEIGK